MSRAAVCRQCHQEIAVSSKLCPHCGEKKPVHRTPYWLVPAIVVVVLLIAVLLITWGGSEQPGQQYAAQVTDTESVSTTEDSAPTPLPITEAVPAVPQTPVATEPQTQTKWTRDWANIRADRNVGSEVVDMLEPGDQIEVADLQSRWWAVYVNGRRYGYISASLVADERPTFEPDTTDTVSR